MKILVRALIAVVAVFVFALTNQTPVQAQNRIEDRFANVNGVRLHYVFIVRTWFLNIFAPSGATRSTPNGAGSFLCRSSINISRLTAQ